MDENRGKDLATPRVIGIVCPSYSGSTMLSSVLAGIPGVFCPGETHWLAEEVAPDWRTHCRQCWPANECPVFTDGVRKSFHDDQNDWWPRMAEIGKTGIVISADKHLSYYAALGLPDVALIPYRNPISWACSWALKTLELGGGGNESPHARIYDAGLLRRGLSTWRQQTEQSLAAIDARNLPAVVVSMERMAVVPSMGLEILCDALDLPGSAETRANLLTLRPRATAVHSIGGNFSLTDGPGLGWSMTTNTSWQKVLTVTQVSDLLAPSDAWDLYRRLESMDVLRQLG